MSLKHKVGLDEENKSYIIINQVEGKWWKIVNLLTLKPQFSWTWFNCCQSSGIFKVMVVLYITLSTMALRNIFDKHRNKNRKLCEIFSWGENSLWRLCWSHSWGRWKAWLRCKRGVLASCNALSSEVVMCSIPVWVGDDLLI